MSFLGSLRVKNLLYPSPVGTKVSWFCSTLLFSHSPLTNSICLVTSSPLLSSHSEYFLLLLFSLSNDLWSAMLSLGWGVLLHSVSPQTQVLIGLSVHTPRCCSLMHHIFHHVNEETESLFCLSLPRLHRKLAVLTWADTFPTRQKKGNKTKPSPLVICVQLSQILFSAQQDGSAGVWGG